jgi:hypothetical protein
MAADDWELRTARLEGAYEQVDRRLGAVESRLATLEHKMDTGFARVRAEINGFRDTLHADMRRQFYWLLGVMVSGFLVLLRLADY